MKLNRNKKRYLFYTEQRAAVETIAARDYSAEYRRILSNADQGKPIDELIAEHEQIPERKAALDRARAKRAAD